MLFLFRSFLLLSILLFPFVLSSLQKEDCVVREYILSPPGEEFDCHSSSLIEASPGILCAAWKGGPGKGHSNTDMKENVGIWLSIFKNGQWGEPQQIVQSPNSVSWSPVLAKYPNGKLLLFYRIGADPRHTTSLVKSSSDGGKTWSKGEILPAGIIGPTKLKPLVDKEGSLICGSSAEVGAPEDEFKATACWIEVLSNQQQWSKYGPLEIPGKRFGSLEPALFWDSSGNLKMLCRDRSNKIGGEGWIWTAESKDKGKTWSALRKTELPNPDSGIEAVSLDGEKAILIYNHSHTNRYPLSIAISHDNGNSWMHLFHLEEKTGEFPSAIVDSEGLLHITYAWMPPGKTQRKIKHIVMDSNKLAMASHRRRCHSQLHSIYL